MVKLIFKGYPKEKTKKDKDAEDFYKIADIPFIVTAAIVFFVMMYSSAIILLRHQASGTLLSLVPLNR